MGNVIFFFYASRKSFVQLSNFELNRTLSTAYGGVLGISEREQVFIATAKGRYGQQSPYTPVLGK